MQTMTNIAGSHGQEGFLTDNEGTKAPTVYKKTEVGHIPNDWDLIPLGLLVKITSGESPSRFQFKSEGIPYFKVEQLSISCKYLEDTPYYFTKDDKKVASGSLIFPKRGASIFLNKVNILNYESFMDTNLMTLTPKNSLDSEYLYYALKHVQLWRIADTTSIPQINNKHITPLLMALPSREEQKAIAKALHDVDELIEGLYKLIAKKHDIKQATMQQLLTGKRRLPGFNEVWIPISMAKHSTLKARIGWQGLTTNEYLRSGSYALITGTDFFDGKIEWSECYFVEQVRYDQDKNIQVQKGDVLLTKDGTIGKAAYIDCVPIPATLNSGVFVIRPRSQAYVPRFLFYILKSQVFSDFLNKLQAGSTISHLYQKDFVNFEFPAPSSLPEQNAIAQVLSDMDEEIEVLEARRDKTKALKQGMMQELLTGRIRLV